MSIKNGCKSLKGCFKAAYNGLREYSEKDESLYILNAIKSFETFLKDYSYMFYQSIIYDLNKLLFKTNKDLISSGLKEKIVILIPGFSANSGGLPKLKQGITEEGYSCIPIDNRLLYHNIQKLQHKTIKDILNIIKNNPNRDIVLFGYSHGGHIARLIGSKHNIPVVTYGASMNTLNSPFRVGAELFGLDTNKHTCKETDNSINIVEEYSITNPFPGDSIVAKGVLNHFTPNRPEVTKLILKGIKESFDSLI